jgi:hypothetical protein
MLKGLSQIGNHRRYSLNPGEITSKEFENAQEYNL